jgi:hypothetical protein
LVIWALVTVDVAVLVVEFTTVVVVVVDVVLTVSAMTAPAEHV